MLRMAHFSQKREVQPYDVKVKRLGMIEGLKLWVVDGFLVRTLIDVEFALGGNPGRYSYIPLDEIWIEDTGNSDDMSMNADHEVVEYHLMVEGLSYNAAHAQASARERELRKLFV